MSTLQEEIFEIIRQRYLSNEYIIVTTMTESIIQAFEKRIENIWYNGDTDDNGRLSFYKDVKELLR